MQLVVMTSGVDDTGGDGDGDDDIASGDDDDGVVGGHGHEISHAE